VSDLQLPPPADPSGEPAPLSTSDILARKKLPTLSVPILIDADTGETVNYVIKGLGRPDFDALRGKHPPTKAQRDEFRKAALAAGMASHQVGELTYNSDTFPSALLAACIVSPTTTVDEAQALWNSDEVSDGELADLFGTALALCTRNQVNVLGKGSRRTTASPPS
jgi:hypothetical protein